MESRNDSGVFANNSAVVKRFKSPQSIVKAEDERLPLRLPLPSRLLLSSVSLHTTHAFHETSQHSIKFITLCKHSCVFQVPIISLILKINTVRYN